MLTTIKERLGREEREKGFTLIELMVVVLIIAILLAIAIPTFLGARNSANSRAAQSNVRNALTAEQTYYTNNQSFSNSVTAGGDLFSVEPNLGWSVTLPATAKGGNTVFVQGYQAGVALGGAADAANTNTGETAVVLSAYSNDGNCYQVLQIDATTGGVTPGTYYSATSAACAAVTWPAAVANVGVAGRATSPAANIGNGKWYTSW